MSRFTLRLSKLTNYHRKLSKSAVIGWLALVCGFSGNFLHGLFFVPAGFIISILAILFGQFLLGFLGLILNLIGLLLSIKLLFLIGKLIFFILTGFDEIFDYFDTPFPERGKDI